MTSKSSGNKSHGVVGGSAGAGRPKSTLGKRNNKETARKKRAELKAKGLNC